MHQRRTSHLLTSCVINLFKHIQHPSYKASSHAIMVNFSHQGPRCEGYYGWIVPWSNNRYSMEIINHGFANTLLIITIGMKWKQLVTLHFYLHSPQEHNFGDLQHIYQLCHAHILYHQVISSLCSISNKLSQGDQQCCSWIWLHQN